MVPPILWLLLGVTAIVMLIWPVFPGLTLAAVLTTVVMPVNNRLLARLKRPGLAAFICTAGAALLILLPLAAVVFMVGTEAVALIEWLQTRQGGVSGATDGVRGTLASTAARFGLDPATLIALVRGQAQRGAEIVANRTLGFLSGIPGVLLQFGVSLFALFYMLRDADLIVDSLRRLAPMEPTRTDELLTRARDIVHATVFGNMTVAVVQGLIGGFTFRLLGLPAAALWGTIMAVMAMIPMVGPPIVWIPASIYLAVSGHLVKGIILAGVGALIIGTVDNFIRAIFVGGRARVHSLVVFLSVIGGVLVFGASGIVVGPVLFVLALIAIEAGRMGLGDRRHVILTDATPRV